MKFKLYEATHFYTDGIKTIKVKDGAEIPPGFYKGRTFKSNPWNKGLTMEDERVRNNIQSRKPHNNYNPWNKGLTKETSSKVAEISTKVSNSTKGRTAWNKGIPMSDAAKEKLAQSNKGRVPYNKGLTKDTCVSLKNAGEKLKGHPCFVTDWKAAKNKEYQTKKLNKSFNTSKPEKDLINDLIIKYGEDDIIHPYRDERYPYNCDAYIKSLDLFIEYHGTWEHGGHPFNPNSEEDIAQLERWKEKSEISNRYAYAIYYWTELDPKKLDTFRKNSLNFKIIYPNGNIISQ